MLKLYMISNVVKGVEITRAFPTVQLALDDYQDVKQTWEGSGYYVVLAFIVMRDGSSMVLHDEYIDWLSKLM